MMMMMTIYHSLPVIAVVCSAITHQNDYLEILHEPLFIGADIDIMPFVSSQKQYT
jgi:hypothetical protein